MTELFLSRLHFPVTTLGPGRRVGIWFQGCSLRCRGCISADTWAVGRKQTTVADSLEVLRPWLAEADGVTVSGGEPFEQPGALLALLREIRATFDGDVLVYTGYERSEIEQTLAEADGLIDALMTGRFELGGPQTLPLRGSDNQQLIPLTETGRRRFAPYQRPDPGGGQRRLDVMFDDDGGIWFAGVPAQGDFEALAALLRETGADVATSVDQAGHVARTGRLPSGRRGEAE